jgi:hypothetical protein
MNCGLKGNWKAVTGTYIGTRPTSASRYDNHKLLQPQEKDPEEVGSRLARNCGTSLSNYTV